MNYRKHKHLTLSEIGIGFYGLSGAYGSKDLNAYRQTIHRAYELGVNFFDTAEGYGDAERFLGETVKPYRDDILIATKVGVREGFKPNLSKEYIQTACECSLKALQTDHIDLYQVHFDDPETPIEETVQAFETLISQGKIRHYGLGHLPIPKIETYLTTGNPFSLLFELSPVAPAALDDLLPACRQYNIGAIAFSATGRGLLTGAITAETTFDPSDIRNLDPLFQRERFSSGLRVVQQLTEIGEKYAKSPVQVAIAWVLAQPGVICALTGPSTVSHLEENLGSSGWQIEPEDYRSLETFLSEENSRLHAKQRTSIGQNLSKEITAEPQQAFTDLIYAIETAVTLNLITEERIMPLFMELYGLKNSLAQEAVPKLDNVRICLENLILI